MAIEVKIPAVGESITSGLLSAWLKKDGELVKDGEPILMLETDKISTEIPAPGSGVIRIQVEAGQEVKIGQVLRPSTKRLEQDHLLRLTEKLREPPQKRNPFR